MVQKTQFWTNFEPLFRALKTFLQKLSQRTHAKKNRPKLLVFFAASFMKLAGFRQFSRDPELEVINKIKQLHNTGYINSSLICCSQRWRLVGTVLWESSEPIFRINEKPFFWLLANWCLGGIWSNWSLFKLRVQNCKKPKDPVQFIWS
jgi:hypothetical protein